MGAVDVEPVSLSVRRDPGATDCPDAAWFSARLAAQRGAGEQRGAFAVDLSREGDTYRATIQRLRGGLPEGAARVLRDRGAQCAPLAEAVAVTLAILAEDWARDPQAPPPVATPAVAAPLPAPPAPSASPPAPRAPRLWAGVGAGALGAFISPAAPALGLGVTFDSPGLRQGLRVTVAWPQRYELGPGRVEVGAWLVTMLSCGRLARESWGVALCAAFDAGQLSGTAEGFPDTTPGMRGYEALGLELQPSWNFASRGRISAVLAALAPFTRESFSVTGLGAAYVPPAASWRALVFSEVSVF